MMHWDPGYDPWCWSQLMYLPLSVLFATCFPVCVHFCPRAYDTCCALQIGSWLRLRIMHYCGLLLHISFCCYKHSLRICDTMETGKNKCVSKLQQEVSGWEVKFCSVVEGDRACESGMSKAEQPRHLPLLHKMTPTVKPVTKRKERGKHINHDCESPSARVFPNWPRACPVQSRKSGWLDLALVGIQGLLWSEKWAVGPIGLEKSD